MLRDAARGGSSGQAGRLEAWAIGLDQCRLASLGGLRRPAVQRAGDLLGRQRRVVEADADGIVNRIGDCRRGDDRRQLGYSLAGAVTIVGSSDIPLAP